MNVIKKWCLYITLYNIKVIELKKKNHKNWKKKSYNNMNLLGWLYTQKSITDDIESYF